MKETDKYIDQLFETAKKESPKVSFEEMSQRFESAIQTPSTSPVGQSWWTPFFNLNTILMLSIGIFTIAFFLSTFSPSTEQHSVLTEQELQKEEIITTIKAENQAVKNSDTSITEAKKTILSPTMLSKDKGAKKTVIPKSNLSDSLSIPETFTNLSIGKVEANDIYKDSSVLESSVALLTEAAKNNSYSARDKKVLDKPTTDELIKSTNLEMQVPIPNEIIESTKEMVNSKPTLLRLHYTDSKETTQLFLYNLKQYGFKVYNSVTRNPKYIKKIVLEITHKKGLEWKLKIRNFEDLEFKVYLDNNDQVTSITYRLNRQGDFSEPLELYHKAKSNHKFSTNNIGGNHSFTRKSHLKNN